MSQASKYGQKSSYAPKATSYTASNATKYQYQGKSINQSGNSAASKYGNNRANDNIYSSQNSNWKVSKPGAQQNYGGRHVGDTQTKVETTQDGDYIIKVTTTRRVIDKKDYYDSLNGKKKY